MEENYNSQHSQFRYILSLRMYQDDEPLHPWYMKAEGTVLKIWQQCEELA
jgi:hypothetical protein